MNAPHARAVAPPRTLTELLSQVEHRMSRRLEEALGPAGPTLDQWRVITFLADAPVGAAR